MAKKPIAKPQPAAFETPAAPIKPATPPKRLIATARPPAGRASKATPVPKDATPAKPAPAVPPVTVAAVVAPPKPAPAAKTPAPAKPAKAKPAAKAAVKPIKLTSSRKKAPTLARVPTHDEIAVRAYILSERRQNHGIYGEPHQDWAEAERQLTVELAS